MNLTLSCGHVAAVTHQEGTARIECAVPSCTRVDLIVAHPTVSVIYENLGRAREWTPRLDLDPGPDAA